MNAFDLLTDNEARDLWNVQGTTAGAITKRGGLQTFASGFTNALTSMFPLESVSPTVMIGFGGGTLYKIQTGGVLTNIAISLTSGTLWDFTSAPVVAGQGPLYGINATDTPTQWTGSGSATNWTNASGSIGVPNGRFCIYHQNQVFIAGTATVPAGMAAAPDPKSRLYWSAIADPTNWDPASLTGAGFMDFDPKDGQAISALGTAGPYLVVCKPRKMWLLIDPAGPTTRRLSDQIGCVAHRSLATGAEGTYFLSEDRGVFVTNGSKITPISDKIQPTINSIDTTATGRSKAAGAYFDGHYYLSVELPATYGGSPAGVNNSTLDFDAKLNSWWKHSFGSNQWSVWHPAGQAQLYSAKSTDIVIDQAFSAGVGTDNGVPFKWTWKGPWQSPTFYRRRRFPTPEQRKRLRQIRCEGSGKIDFSLAKDFDDSAPLSVGSDIFAPNLPATRTNFLYRADALGVANAFSVIFSNTSSAAAQLNAYTLMVSDRKDLIP